MEIKCNSVLEMLDLIKQYHKEHPDHDILPSDSPPYFCYVADDKTENPPYWSAHISTANSIKGTEYEDCLKSSNGRLKVIGHKEFRIGNKVFCCLTAEKAIEEYNKVYERCKQEYFTDDFSMTQNWFGE